MHDLRNYVYALDQSDEDIEQSNQHIQFNLTDQGDKVSNQIIMTPSNDNGQANINLKINYTEKLSSEDTLHFNFIKINVC